MSFLSVLRTIGRDFVIGTQAIAPVVPLIESIPNVGPIFGTVFTAIMAIEQLIPQQKAGPAKKSAVTSIVTAAHPDVSPQDLSVWIDRVVAAVNQLNSVVGMVEANHPAR